MQLRRDSQSIWSPLARSSVDTNLGERRGWGIYFQPKIDSFQSSREIFERNLWCRKACKLRQVQMIPATKSHEFSSFLPLLSLLGNFGVCHHLVETVEDSEVRRLGWDSKNVPIGNLELRQLHERAQKSPQKCSEQPPDHPPVVQKHNPPHQEKAISILASWRA